ncbi:hypothetical protein N7492_002033 [Penicillium capsulatum]|uniref:Uncharacterized protein n=1 Tax=Penicillium capsulatum TaxID=69766 RepID=A0A9W9LUR1_9EURO|nr:hypothetical protein N7492_002033 [Penicillium capsulatum]KAJ6123348.1 hypothetical protein N7512_005813 [Penicillium capsulatum]
MVLLIQTTAGIIMCNISRDLLKVMNDAWLKPRNHEKEKVEAVEAGKRAQSDFLNYFIRGPTGQLPSVLNEAEQAVQKYLDSLGRSRNDCDLSFEIFATQLWAEVLNQNLGQISGQEVSKIPLYGLPYGTPPTGNNISPGWTCAVWQQPPVIPSTPGIKLKSQVQIFLGRTGNRPEVKDNNLKVGEVATLSLTDFASVEMFYDAAGEIEKHQLLFFSGSINLHLKHQVLRPLVLWQTARVAILKLAIGRHCIDPFIPSIDVLF